MIWKAPRVEGTQKPQLCPASGLSSISRQHRAESKLSRAPRARVFTRPTAPGSPFSNCRVTDGELRAAARVFRWRFIFTALWTRSMLCSLLASRKMQLRPLLCVDHFSCLDYSFKRSRVWQLHEIQRLTVYIWDFPKLC